MRKTRLSRRSIIYSANKDESPVWEGVVVWRRMGKGVSQREQGLSLHPQSELELRCLGFSFLLDKCKACDSFENDIVKICQDSLTVVSSRDSTGPKPQCQCWWFKGKGLLIGNDSGASGISIWLDLRWLPKIVCRSQKNPLNFSGHDRTWVSRRHLRLAQLYGCVFLLPFFAVPFFSSPIFSCAPTGMKRIEISRVRCLHSQHPIQGIKPCQVTRVVMQRGKERPSSVYHLSSGLVLRPGRTCCEHVQSVTGAVHSSINEARPGWCPWMPMVRFRNWINLELRRCSSLLPTVCITNSFYVASHV